MQIYRALAAAAFATVLLGAAPVKAQEYHNDRRGTQDKRMPGTLEEERRPGTMNEPPAAMLPRGREPGTVGRDDAQEEVKPLERRRRDLEARDEVEDDMEAAGGEKAPAPNPFRMEGQGGGKKGNIVKY